MPNLKSKRIYIVDDDPFWSELLKGILHSIGYFNVLSFDSGEFLPGSSWSPAGNYFPRL